MEMSKREMARGRLLGHLPKGGVGAEIGVWEGAFSARILDICAPQKLHLIDPWRYMPEFPNTGFGRKKNEFLMEEKYQAVVRLYAGDPRVVIHRATSAEALGALPDGALDFIYIDGNHNAPFVGQDLALARQKVRPGGVIAGDDYNWQSEAQGAPVRQAVEALMADLGGKARLKLIANQYLIRLSPG